MYVFCDFNYKVILIYIQDKTCVLLPPRKDIVKDGSRRNLPGALVGALVTRFSQPSQGPHDAVPQAQSGKRPKRRKGRKKGKQTDLEEAEVKQGDIEKALMDPSCKIESWGRLRRVDTDAGDTIRASSLVPLGEDSRDASFVRVSTAFKVQL
jgi:hypothetical protein